MDNKKFEEVVDTILNDVRNLLVKKGKIYTRGDNRFHNFIRMAHLQNGTLEKSLICLVDKHYVNLHDMINDLEKSGPILLSNWTEKTYDIIVYMILLQSIVVERSLSETEDKEGYGI